VANEGTDDDPASGSTPLARARCGRGLDSGGRDAQQLGGARQGHRAGRLPIEPVDQRSPDVGHAGRLPRRRAATAPLSAWLIVKRRTRADVPDQPGGGTAPA
jgi:hypothetical protein